MSKGLQRVDKLAKSAARSYPRIDRGLVVGKIGRAKIKGSATMFFAAGQVLVIRIVGSRTVGREGENRFLFEVFDEGASVASSGHRFRRSASGADEAIFEVKAQDRTRSGNARATDSQPTPNDQISRPVGLIGWLLKCKSVSPTMLGATPTSETRSSQRKRPE